MFELFPPDESNTREAIGPGSFLLRGFALPYIDELWSGIQALQQQATFRYLMTPGGFRMSVGLISCGRLGWFSDRQGYRYTDKDPETGLAWPSMPAVFARLAHDAAAEAGFADFKPDACLINRYLPGSRLSLHQDKRERDLVSPIVSVSLGVPAIFLFGTHERSGKTVRIPLVHGDVVVWGGVDRMRYHGVLPLRENRHPLVGAQRLNLTFRKVD